MFSIQKQSVDFSAMKKQFKRYVLYYYVINFVLTYLIGKNYDFYQLIKYYVLRADLVFSRGLVG